MRVEKQRYEIIEPSNPEGLIKECKNIELSGRVCYKSEDKITENSWKKFCLMLKNKKHHAMIEHSYLSVKFITDRGISHELTRHRRASFAQESTRYCNYRNDKFNNEITVIDPFVHSGDSHSYEIWYTACKNAEKSYFSLLDNEYPPEIARSVLPTCLKTEIVISTNFREWLHIFSLRCAEDAHPSMRVLMTPLYEYLHDIIPEIFTLYF